MKRQLATSTVADATAASNSLGVSVVAVGPVEYAPAIDLPAPPPPPPGPARTPAGPTAPPANTSDTSALEGSGYVFYLGEVPINVLILGGAGGVALVCFTCLLVFCIVRCCRLRRKRAQPMHSPGSFELGAVRATSTVSVTVNPLAHYAPPPPPLGVTLPSPPALPPPGVPRQLADKLKRMGSRSTSSFSELPRDNWTESPSPTI